MAEDGDDARTLKEKALFYMTAFFVLLGTFSMFAFLFLVPFVIEPAFTTIFMQFDVEPALCVTVEVESFKGVSNCSWTSCKEGCTKEVYECTQIRVNYKVKIRPNATATAVDAEGGEVLESLSEETERFERALREYDYMDGGPGGASVVAGSSLLAAADRTTGDMYSDLGVMLDPSDNESWFFSGARLFPNVKGCGYPPMLNCSIWTKKYKEIGTNFTCYYSQVDPSLVISDLDMWQNTLNLVYAMAIPIPSFIISVIYLTFAYFKIYNEDEETVPLDKNAEDMAGEDPQQQQLEDGGQLDGEDEEEIQMDVDEVTKGGEEEADSTGSEQLTTPNSDMPSFGQQMKVQMADEMSRGSLDPGFMSQSGSFHGNLSKTMTTSISTPPGQIDAV